MRPATPADPVTRAVIGAAVRTDAARPDSEQGSPRSASSGGRGALRVVAALGVVAALCAGAGSGFVPHAGAAPGPSPGARVGPATGPAPAAHADGSAQVVTDAPGAARPSLSADGRWVAYGGVAADGRRTAYRTDRVTGETTELTPVPDGVRPGGTVNPVLSSDGCVAVVQTEMALDVFRDDDAGQRWDVYRTVLPECGGAAGVWELVSGRDGTGTARDDVDVSAPATTDASGTLVAYAHPASGLDGVTTVSVADLTVPLGGVGRTREVPALPAEAPTAAYHYRGVSQPVLSDDGAVLAFTADTTADAALPGWSEGPEPGGPATTQVYAWRTDDTDPRTRIRLVSGRDGQPAVAGAHSPAVSDDGSVVAFVSADRSLVDATFPRCEAACPTQVFRAELPPAPETLDLSVAEPDLDPAVVTIVSADRSGIGDPVAGSQHSWAPAVSADGSQVVFVSRAADLLTDRVPAVLDEGLGDVFVAEIPNGALWRATGAVPDGPVAAAHAAPAVSATGRVLVFESARAREIVGAAGAVGAEPGDEDRGIVAVVAVPDVSLPDLDFGTVVPAVGGDELFVTVSNDGPGAFAPARVESTTTNFRVTDDGTCRPGAIVPAGSTCTVHVRFDPDRPVAYAGVLTVTEATDGAVGVVEGAQVSVSATMSGVGGEPVVRVEPAGLDLGEATVGRPGERRAVDVRNVSGLPTEVAAIELDGAHPDDVVVTAESCTGRALNPNATCSVEVEFRPTDDHRRSALVRVRAVTGESSAAVVSGVATYRPELHLSDPTVVAGESLGVGVVGFPVGAEVQIALDGRGPLLTVRADETGGALAAFEVPPRERDGERTVIASTADGHVATATVRVDREDQRTPGLPGFGLG